MPAIKIVLILSSQLAMSYGQFYVIDLYALGLLSASIAKQH